MSNFTDVAKLNTLWGNLKGDPLNPNWDKLKSQAKNILDEYNELMDDGIDPRNMTEVRDAICDILVFTYGLAHMAGINVDEDMLAVNLSNLSKFCKNPDELLKTIVHYQNLGVQVHAEGCYPEVVVRSSKEQTGNDGKLYQNNKILKCVNWQEPVFKDFSSEVYDE